MTIAQTKICSKCKRELPRTSEYFHRRGNSFKSWCKECRSWKTLGADTLEVLRQKGRANYHKNPQKHKEMVVRWRSENHHQMLETMKRYNRNHKEEIATYLHDYAQKNKEKYRLYNANRRARLLLAEGDISSLDVGSLFEEQQGLCYYCGCSIENGYEVEHKTPLSRGGSNLKANLCLSCEHCNDIKHCKNEEEFVELLCR